MSLTLADRDPLEVTIDDLREVIDLWADRGAAHPSEGDVGRARLLVMGRGARARAVLPAASCDAHAPQEVATLLPTMPTPRLLNRRAVAARSGGARLLLDLGVRPSRARRHAYETSTWIGAITVFGRGQKEPRDSPPRSHRREIDRYLSGDSRMSGDRLSATTTSSTPPKRTGGRGQHARTPIRRGGSSPQTIHRWWYRARWGSGPRRRGRDGGLNMHRASHSFAPTCGVWETSGLPRRRSVTAT